MSTLYNKYIVRKADGSPTEKDAQYFVLRIDSDPAARYALNAYALHIFKDDPQFSRQLLAWIEKCESASNNASRRTGLWACPHCGYQLNLETSPACEECQIARR